MKFLVQPYLNKDFFEYSILVNQFFKSGILLKKIIWKIGKGILIVLTLFMKFIFLRPQLVRQVGPNQFEDVNNYRASVGHFYV